ncbi:MAG: hypothetical protein WDZ77_03320 [Candidatus Pacearchaeota archaeon]
MKVGVSNLILIKNKRGISTVVATLILVLISIIAVGIVWGVVQNVISENTNSDSISQFTINLEIIGAYVDGSTIFVNLRRNSGSGNLAGVNFIFSNEQQGHVVKRYIILSELESRLFNFTSFEAPGIENGDRVSVAPIIDSGNQQVVGAITHSFLIGGSGSTGTGSGDDSGGSGNESEEEGNESGGETPGTCDGVWEGSSEDLDVECDGTPTPNNCFECQCDFGFSGDGSGNCVADPSINTGTINTVWPSDATKYFDSPDLPTDASEISSYIGKYVNFSGAGADLRCLRISYAEYLDSEFNSSYIRVELIAELNSGNTYEVWNSETCGAA